MFRIPISSLRWVLSVLRENVTFASKFSELYWNCDIITIIEFVKMIQSLQCSNLESWFNYKETRLAGTFRFFFNRKLPSEIVRSARGRAAWVYLQCNGMFAMFYRLVSATGHNGSHKVHGEWHFYYFICNTRSAHSFSAILIRVNLFSRYFSVIDYLLRRIKVAFLWPQAYL